MNRVIQKFKKALNNEKVYSFGDDITFFYKSRNYETHDFVNWHKKKLQNILKSVSSTHNELRINEDNVKLYFYQDWYNEQMLFYNNRKSFYKLPTTEKLCSQLSNMNYQNVDDKIKYLYVYKQFKDFTISNQCINKKEEFISTLSENNFICNNEKNLLERFIDNIWTYESLFTTTRQISKELNIEKLWTLIELDPSVLMYINPNYFNNND